MSIASSVTLDVVTTMTVRENIVGSGNIKVSTSGTLKVHVDLSGSSRSDIIIAGGTLDLVGTL